MNKQKTLSPSTFYWGICLVFALGFRILYFLDYLVSGEKKISYMIVTIFFILCASFFTFFKSKFDYEKDE